MQMIELKYPFSSLEKLGPAVLAIGYFDGVHIGHLEVIGKAKQIASQKGIPCGVMTFDPHPREVLGTTKINSYLTPLEEKLRQFQKLELDYVVLIEFDVSFSKISPVGFLEKVLLPIGTDTVVVGFDFTFGHLGKGTSEMLKQLGQEHFDVQVVEPIKRYGEKVSSTVIREQLHEGQVDNLTSLLGRNYSIEGTVVEGDARGRTIGFPTANIELTAPYMVPRQGVYVVKVMGDDLDKYAVMNVGVKPTFKNDKLLTLEAHLLGFQGDLYGQKITVEFLHYLRMEKKFDGVQALIEQIQMDVHRALQWIDQTTLS
jgi:riboflavin kinase/FMN adenylyltransferase